ncbi:MAG: hypothetical protein ACOC41_01745 [Chitinivibrionales bacterium]
MCVSIRKLTSFSLAVALLFANCSTVRHVRPLKTGQQQVTLSLGGPITEVGKSYLPLPLLGVGYTYGLRENLSLEGGLGVTSLLFGIMQLDAGCSFFPFKANGWVPGVFISPRFFLITDFEKESLRLFPDLDFGGYWEYKRHYFYLGLESWFEIHSDRSDGVEQKHHWLAVPFLGYGIEKNRWSFQLEARVYTPNLENTGRATKNIGIGDNGILGVFLGVNRQFGGRDE